MEESPIVPIETKSQTEEVNGVEVPKRKKSHHKKKESGDDVVKTLNVIASSLKDLTASVAGLSDRLNVVEQYTSTMKPVESPTGETIVKSAEPGKEDQLITAVKKVLGQGSPEKCQFIISTEPDKTSASFRLLIVPPEHLKESDMDVRVKRLSYHDGVSGAEVYAKIVLERCLKIAQRNALSFFAE